MWAGLSVTTFISIVTTSNETKNDLKWNGSLRLLFNIQTSDYGATTVAKISLKWNRALWLLFNIQSSDYSATTVAKISLYFTYTRSTVSFDYV